MQIPYNLIIAINRIAAIFGSNEIYIQVDGKFRYEHTETENPICYQLANVDFTTNVTYTIAVKVGKEMFGFTYVNKLLFDTNQKDILIHISSIRRISNLFDVNVEDLKDEYAELVKSILPTHTPDDHPAFVIDINEALSDKAIIHLIEFATRQ